MATKQISLGSLLKVDHDQNAVFESMTLVVEITPPPRTRAETDGNDLGDTLEVNLLGRESQSKMEFDQFWHPGDTEHEKMDTLFGSKAEADFQIVTPHATPVTDEFSGQVIGLTPESLTPTGAYKRKVTIQRTTAITRS